MGRTADADDQRSAPANILWQVEQHRRRTRCWTVGQADARALDAVPVAHSGWRFSDGCRLSGRRVGSRRSDGRTANWLGRLIDGRIHRHIQQRL